ncbi:MAG: PTS lactose/cellobiose transporter subunit IIA [Clostridium sp.]|nr:PTS lactose/cellobiose transporter subunit IIA [Clostridium sp.]
MNENIVNNIEEDIKEKTARIAMEMVINAGDARNLIMQAFDSVTALNFEEAKIKLKYAQSKIHEAHKYQTEVIQSEASGEYFEYSILFTHAQDTLMTICTELNLARKICSISENIDARIKNLEENRE